MRTIKAQEVRMIAMSELGKGEFREGGNRVGLRTGVGCKIRSGLLERPC